MAFGWGSTFLICSRQLVNVNNHYYLYSVTSVVTVGSSCLEISVRFFLTESNQQ